MGAAGKRWGNGKETGKSGGKVWKSATKHGEKRGGTGRKLKKKRKVEEFGVKSEKFGWGKGGKPLYPTRRPLLYGALTVGTAHA